MNKQELQNHAIEEVKFLTSILAEFVRPCAVDGELFLPSRTNQKYCTNHQENRSPSLRRFTYRGARFQPREEGSET